MNDSPIIDHHEFDVWDHADGSVSISVQRDGLDTDTDTAYLRSAVINRILGEELKETNEVFRMIFYDNGSSSTLWREDSDWAQNWPRVRWLKSMVHTTIHNPMIALPMIPNWLSLTFWWLEYALSKIILKWWLITGRAVRVSNENHGVVRNAAGWVGGSDEPLPASETPPESPGSNVIAFRPRVKKADQ